MLSFKELGLSEETLKGLSKKGFEEPTPIQEKSIPYLLNEEGDLVGQAQTGTGKTAAFGLPMIELFEEKCSHIQSLILAPTRELAIQVAEEINSLKGRKKLTIIPVYGGQSIDLQLRLLKKGVDIVVGTPGRIIDHLHRKTLNLEKIKLLVLDEADEMLNMGFIDDVKEILSKTNQEKRTLLFSATMPSEILHIAKNYMKSYTLFKVTPDQLTVNNTEQIYFEVAAADKFEALCRIIDMEHNFYGLVFCRTKVDVDDLSSHLLERGYEADALHGDISQHMRERILNKFKKRQINILIATDVAARGIDVQDLTHVINYSLPQDTESYIHRIGRTGRAGKEGNAITFITPEEYRKLNYIRREAKTDIRKATLPKVKDIIEKKKVRIKNDLSDIIERGIKNDFLNMSTELLAENSPENLFAALLQYSFSDELDSTNYAEIHEANIDRKGKTRLFVSQGKADGLNIKKLINIIKEKCNISPDKIKDILVLDKFSFVTLPFNEAELLLSYFKKNRRDDGPVFKKAKERAKN
ncbi:MAG: DEAD/DEAH box helicase [Candidatus Cloacimonetes bacterium]|nr:DEAD/DEAH box helicase [Candidatus Cloacimonadota bacterium]